VKGHLGGAFVESFAVLTQHQAASAASTKLVITPSSKVQKMSHLLHVKLEFQNFPTMYNMQKDISKVGSHVAVKLNNVDLPLLNV
jgi:TPP-dependent 2-oxoacid decarboxylase